MRDEFSLVTNPGDTAVPADRIDLDGVLVEYPWLKNLEPFYIEWELIWPM
jgi:hypothetical protein